MTDDTRRAQPVRLSGDHTGEDEWPTTSAVPTTTAERES